MTALDRANLKGAGDEDVGWHCRPGWYTFGPGQFGPPQVLGLQRRISKNLPTPVVVNSQAYGRLYAGGPPAGKRNDAASG